MNQHYLSDNGKFKRGNPGRQKGSKNKASPKAIFMTVFDDIGGIEGFVKWVKASRRNRGMFYQMFAKMLPTNVDFGEMFEKDVKMILEVIHTPAPPEDKEDEDQAMPEKIEKSED